MNWIALYNEYLELYDKGLKKKAKAVLLDFIDDFKKQSKTEKRRFIDEIKKKAFETEKSNKLLPYNLYHEIILPEIKQWIEDEPANSIPKRWSNDLEINKTGVELNPSDQIALELLARKIIAKVSMNQHEVSAGYSYDGNPKEDLLLIDFLEKYVSEIKVEERRNEIVEILNELKNVLWRQ